MPFLYPDIHSDLHSKLKIVPPLDPITASRVLADFVPTEGDYVVTLETLMRTIEASVRNIHAGQIERMNASVTVSALELQLPIIRSEAIDPTTSDFVSKTSKHRTKTYTGQ